MTERAEVWCGVDPGLASMGVAFLLREDTRWRALHVATVRTKPSEPMHERMLKLHAAIVHRPATGYPSPIHHVVEDQEGARIGKRAEGLTNSHADLVERVIGMLWEHALMSLYSVDRELIFVTPIQMRRRVGFGPCGTKKQMRVMLSKIVTGLPSVMSEHAADAVVVAITGEAEYRRRKLAAETQEQRFHRLMRL